MFTSSWWTVWGIIRASVSLVRTLSPFWLSDLWLSVPFLWWHLVQLSHGINFLVIRYDLNLARLHIAKRFGQSDLTELMNILPSVFSHLLVNQLVASFCDYFLVIRYFLCLKMSTRMFIKLPLLKCWMVWMFFWSPLTIPSCKHFSELILQCSLRTPLVAL